MIYAYAIYSKMWNKNVCNLQGDFAEADDDSSAESDQNYLMMKTGDQKALNLPKPVIKEGSDLKLYLSPNFCHGNALIWTCCVQSLKSSMKKDREKVPMNNIELTKSLIRLPMEFWGDSMVNWKGLAWDLDHKCSCGPVTDRLSAIDCL